MNIVKKVISITSLTALIASLSLNAQTPEGSVNAEGQLVIGDLVIDPPSGEVDAQGNLVIDGTTIPKPEATVNADGSLTVGDETFQVPDVPVTAFLDLYEFAPGVYYHDYIGTIWTVEGETWIYVNMLSGLDGGAGGWAWLATSTGNTNAFWLYSSHFDDWFFIFNGEGGLQSISEVEGRDPKEYQSGFIYSSSQTEWRFYFEDVNGGYFNYTGVEGEFIMTFNRD